MARTLTVELGERSYPILIGVGQLAALGEACRPRLRAGAACLVVSDAHVDPLYGPAAEAALRAAGFRPAREAVPAGEDSKSPARLEALCRRMLAAGLDRGAFVVALGGGVVGDLAGFAAAVFMRGIPCVQVPTSLLAMVDSAVGGKTGVNLPEGKNLLGAFHQPALVLADPATLRTLPRREYLSGLAEAVKYGVIRDAAFFQWLENERAALAAGDPGRLEAVVARCCEIKADVVARDEREGGLRAILNFGHTAGHALEQAAGYGTYLHGEAVAVGMVFAARLAQRVLGFPAGEAARLEELLRALGLPTAAPGVPWERLQAALRRDKKNQDQRPRYVLARRLGETQTGCEVPAELPAEVWHVIGQ